MPRRCLHRALALALILVAVACSAGGAREPDAAADGARGPEDGARPDRAVPDTGFGPVCETGSVSTDPLPATLMIQVDTSGSMNCPADQRGCAVAEPTPAPDDSRWDVFRNRLNDALAGLPDSTSAGLMHYPGAGSSCAPTTPLVPIGRLAETRASIRAAMDALVPTGITPTHDAVVHALARLRDSGGDDRYLVLATDGAATVCEGCDPGCSFDALDADHERLVARIGEAAAWGIPTFVIGVPGSQGYRRILSRMASAAGTERAADCSDAGPVYCHYDLTDAGVDFARELSDALASIGDAILSCEYAIPPNPDEAFDPARVNVRIVDERGEEVIGRDRDHRDGWDYSEDGLRIIVHGDACERARAASGGRIEVAFGCPTILI